MFAYLFRVLIAIDRLANAILLGHPDETISGRAARARRLERRWGCLLCWLLEKIDPNHCDEAIQRDREDAGCIEDESK